MKKPVKTAPTVLRDDKGRIIKGSGAINGGGLTEVQRAARDVLGMWLCEEPQIECGKESYLRLLREGNPVIVKDYMDRVAGKVKEHLEVTGDGKRPLSFEVLTREDMLEISRIK